MGTQLRVLLRSLSVQGSWSYERLIGTGLAYMLLPALRRLHRRDPAALRAAVARHAGVFNSHPYLATVAAGAIVRLEADGADPGLIDRFKGALRGSLGALGDQLVWGAWRPAAVLLAIALLLAGAPWWLAVAAFLVVYNAMHLALRVWGWRIGMRGGLDVARTLRAAPLQAIAGRAADAGAILAGFAAVLTVANPVGVSAAEVGAALLGVGLGFWLKLRTRAVMGAVVVIAWACAIILGLIA